LVPLLIDRHRAKKADDGKLSGNHKLDGFGCFNRLKRVKSET
jgi:hypothetical protein